MNGVLINSNPILDVPRLKPETFINIGGVQIKKKLDPLPEDIKEFMEGAEHGVIVLALGFTFNPKYIPQERMDALFSTLGKLPQRVIARFQVS